MKLVRDNIPEIIEKQGDKAIFIRLEDKSYHDALLAKLTEETNEFLEDQNAEELCDILEVVFALAKSIGVSRDELETIRKQKADKNGAFEKQLGLIELKRVNHV